jgi:hypothetical protein
MREIMSSRWRLEVHDETKGRGSILSFFEFDDFPSLRSKIVENRARAFLVRVPDHANQSELAGLLDLRGQGFKLNEIAATLEAKFGAGSFCLVATIGIASPSEMASYSR